jgi:uncharacterized protein
MRTATTRAVTRPWRGLLAAALTLLALATPVAAQTAPAASVDFPRLSGRVVDEADVLSDRDRIDLVSRLATLEAKTGDQLVVVTLRSLRGQTIEQYCLALGRHWQIGQKGKNNGILFLVAPADRKARIEVGYGLERTLTDTVASFILEQTILPHFRAGDMAGGIVRGTDDIIGVLTGDAADWQRRAAAFAPSFGSRFSHVFVFSGSVALGLALAAVCVLILAAIGWMLFGALVELLIWIGALPTRRRRGSAPVYGDERDFGVGIAGSSVPVSSMLSMPTGGFAGGGGASRTW